MSQYPIYIHLTLPPGCATKVLQWPRTFPQHPLFIEMAGDILGPQTQVTTIACMALNNPIHVRPLPSSLHFIHSAPGTQASLSFSSTPGWHHLKTFVLVNSCSLECSSPLDVPTALLVTSFRALLKCYLIIRAPSLYFPAYKSLPSNSVYVLHTLFADTVSCPSHPSRMEAPSRNGLLSFLFP